MSRHLSDMTVDIMKDTPAGKLAMEDFGEVDENFRIYEMSLYGPINKAHGITVVGCVFQEATSGRNKGKLCVIVPGTTKTTNVSTERLRNHEAAGSKN